MYLKVNTLKNLEPCEYSDSMVVFYRIFYERCASILKTMGMRVSPYEILE